MSWLEKGPTPAELSALPVSARAAADAQSSTEYDHVSKESNPDLKPLINGEDVEDMKQRLATFEYLLRHLTVQYNEQSDYLKKLLDRTSSDKPKKRIKHKRRIREDEAAEIIEQSLRRRRQQPPERPVVVPPMRTTSRIKIEHVNVKPTASALVMAKTEPRIKSSKIAQYFWMTLLLAAMGSLSVLLRTYESEIRETWTTIPASRVETSTDDETFYIASYFQ